MGTTREWGAVAFAAIFWGGWMLVWMTLLRKPKHAISSLDVIVWALMGLVYGLTMTFHWRAFRVPLVFLTVGALTCALGAGMLFRQKGSKTHDDSDKRT